VIADTSVMVAAVAPWHEHHHPAQAALRGVDRAIAHTILETYSVLTRLPAPFRVAPDVAAELLEARFVGDHLELPAAELRRLVPRLSSAGVSGGATYDGLIACTAAHFGLTLLTLDRRAAESYRRCAVEFELVA